MYDLGHTVVGVEAVEEAAKQFFKENNLTPVIEEVPAVNGKVYKVCVKRHRWCIEFLLNNMH